MMNITIPAAKYNINYVEPEKDMILVSFAFCSPMKALEFFCEKMAFYFNAKLEAGVHIGDDITTFQALVAAKQYDAAYAYFLKSTMQSSMRELGIYQKFGESFTKQYLKGN